MAARCSPRPCSSGAAGASTSAHGMRCAAAAPTWTCWSRSAPPRRTCSAPIVTLARTRASTSTSRRGATVITLVLLGKLLEARARAPARRRRSRACCACSRASRTCCATASMHDVPLDDVVAGDRFVVRAGEAMPVDGIVERGAALRRREHADRREPARSPRRSASACTPARVNLDGVLDVRAHRRGRGDAARRRSCGSCAQAQGSKAPIQRLADRVSRRVRAGRRRDRRARRSAITWIVLGRRLSTRAGARRRACWSSPVRARSVSRRRPRSSSAPGRAAQLGLLVRDAAALERAAALDVLIVDKTGTLTEGRLSVAAVLAVGGARDTRRARARGGARARREPSDRRGDPRAPPRRAASTSPT